jgi:hypothetical protein
MKQNPDFFHIQSGDGVTLPEDEQRIIRYLLNETDEEELSMVEERLSNDTAFFELIASVEDELIMKYVRGEMEEDLKPRFEKAYLESSERRARIESARQLRAAVREVAASRRLPRGRPFFAMPRRAQIAFAVFILLLGIASPILWKRFFQRITIPTTEARGQMSVILTPGRMRGTGTETGVEFVVPAGTREVQFHLKTSDLPIYSSYQVRLGTPENPALFTGPAKVEDGGLLAVVPASVLTAGDYTLDLQGVVPNSDQHPIGTYYFRSVR